MGEGIQSHKTSWGKMPSYLCSEGLSGVSLAQREGRVLGEGGQYEPRPKGEQELGGWDWDGGILGWGTMLMPRQSLKETREPLSLKCVFFPAYLSLCCRA